MIRGRLERAFPDAEWRDQVREVAMILPNLAKLLGRLAKDPRVPRRSKMFAAAAAAYVVSPIDLVPEFLPIVGQIDDVVVVALALDHLIEQAGVSLVREHWDGPDQLLSLLIDLIGTVAGVVPRPVRMVLNRWLRS